MQIRKADKDTIKKQSTATDQISTADCVKPNTTKQKQIKNHHKPNKKAGTTPATWPATFKYSFAANRS
jgi:hypothetical protein